MGLLCQRLRTSWRHTSITITLTLSMLSQNCTVAFFVTLPHTQAINIISDILRTKEDTDADSYPERLDWVQACCLGNLAPGPARDVCLKRWCTRLLQLRAHQILWRGLCKAEVGIDAPLRPKHLRSANGFLKALGRDSCRRAKMAGSGPLINDAVQPQTLRRRNESSRCRPWTTIICIFLTVLEPRILAQAWTSDLTCPW